MAELPGDYFFSKSRFTRKQHVDVYPAVDPSTPALSQAGRTVIITGASRGAGVKAFAPAFAQAGVKAIVLAARSIDELKLVEKELNRQYPSVATLAVSVDVTNETSVKQLFAQIRSELGHADILINNAGVSCGGGDIHDEDSHLWWRNFEVNVKGSFCVTQQFLRQLPSPSSTANIVNIISNAAWEVFPTISGYSVSKLALFQLTTHLSAGYPEVTSTSLHPGFMDTDMLPDFFQHITQSSFKLAGGVLVWLCTPPARFLDGRMIAADWDVEELMQRQSDIEKDDLLKMRLHGEFGPEQFR